MELLNHNSIACPQQLINIKYFILSSTFCGLSYGFVFERTPKLLSEKNNLPLGSIKVDLFGAYKVLVLPVRILIVFMLNTTTSWPRGVLTGNFGGVVRPAPGSPYLISDQNV